MSEIPSWPFSRAADALHFVAERSLRTVRATSESCPPPAGRAAFKRWLERTALASGVDVVEVECAHADVARVLGTASPALVRTRIEGDDRIVALVGRRRGAVLAADEDGAIRPLPAGALGALFESAPADAPAIASLVELAGIEGADRARAAAELTSELASESKIDGIFVIDEGPGRSVRENVLQGRRGGPLAAAIASHVVGSVLTVGSWLVLTYVATHTVLERGAFVLWALLGICALGLRAFEAKAQLDLALRSARVVKRRFLASCLAAPVTGEAPLGVGSAIARIADAGTIETALASGGLSAILTAFDLLALPIALQFGTRGPLLAALFLLALAGHVWIAVTLFRRRARWTDARLRLTEDLLDRMLGHRTRLLQESGDRWHVGEDKALASYWRETAALDDRQAFAANVPSRLFVLVGLAFVGLAFAYTTADPTLIFLTIAGLLLGETSLQRLSEGLTIAGDIGIAGRTLRPLLGRPPRVHTAPVLPETVHGSDIVLEARNVHVKEPLRAHPILDRGSLVVREGERLLVEGPSGGGKTTLAGVLAGLRSTSAAQVLFRGFDAATIGDAEEVGWSHAAALRAGIEVDVPEAVLRLGDRGPGPSRGGAGSPRVDGGGQHRSLVLPSLFGSGLASSIARSCPWRSARGAGAGRALAARRLSRRPWPRPPRPARHLRARDRPLRR